MNSVSIDNVISKVLRDTRVPDSSYIADMHEWIPEAMGLLGTQAEMAPDYQVVPINFHLGKLPCGVIDIEAVQYQGTRLGWYNGIRYPSKLNNMPEEPVFTTELTTTEMPSGPVLDTTVVAKLPVSASDGYKVFMGHILTTFADGEVILYFKKMMTDTRGLPLIPDHADYREALYWYVRSKMIQSGYDDPVYHNDDRVAWTRFETHAARAIGSITYPSVDQKEAQIAGQVFFIPPDDYYDSFFNTVNPEPPLGDLSITPNFVKQNVATLNNGH